MVAADLNPINLANTMEYIRRHPPPPGFDAATYDFRGVNADGTPAAPAPWAIKRTPSQVTVTSCSTCASSQGRCSRLASLLRSCCGLRSPSPDTPDDLCDAYFKHELRKLNCRHLERKTARQQRQEHKDALERHFNARMEARERQRVQDASPPSSSRPRTRHG